MEGWFIPLRLMISFLIGSVIGLEREINEKKTMKLGQKPQAVLGLRSFSLVTSLGTIIGFLYSTLPALALLLGGGLVLLFIVFYAVDSLVTKDTGLTTEIALIYSFLIGLLLSFNVLPVQVTLALSVVLILILSRKRRIKDVVGDIHRSELDAFIAFAIIAIVILPFLPNKSYSLSDFSGITSFINSLGLTYGRIVNIELLNPFKLWFIVVLITGIDLLGYVLERLVGQKKGWILASIAGGFISSTATTQSLAQQSKDEKGTFHLVAAALIANSVSFIQIVLLLSPINPAFVIKLFPILLALIISSIAAALYFLKKKERKIDRHAKAKLVEHKEGIFELGSAFKFLLLYIFISILSKIALEFFGSAAFLITLALGALAGLDAVMINTAQLAGSRIDFNLAVLAFIIANAVNLGGKAFYSFLQGKKEFAYNFAASIIFIIAVSLISTFFMH